MPLIPIEFHFVAHRSSPVENIFGQDLAELFETSVVVVPDVAVRLAEFFGDLGECVALEEVKPERLSLIRR